jgi:ABC-type multidrug transport system fused ATPase/permease subunit
LVAANNVIKVVRDSLFLSRFPIVHLPFVYLLAVVVAGFLIAAYSRYTLRLPLYKLILGSNAFISNLIAFWVLIVFFHFDWAIYAFYVWSAMVGVLSVAEFRKKLNEIARLLQDENGEIQTEAINVVMIQRATNILIATSQWAFV